jgi:ammonia channel protein AmtB
LVKLKIDDPLDAAPIHFICGKWPDNKTASHHPV